MNPLFKQTIPNQNTLKQIQNSQTLLEQNFLEQTVLERTRIQKTNLQDVINSTEFRLWLDNYEKYISYMYEIVNSSSVFLDINIDDFIMFIYFSSSQKLNCFV